MGNEPRDVTLGMIQLYIHTHTHTQKERKKERLLRGQNHTALSQCLLVGHLFLSGHIFYPRYLVFQVNNMT